MTLGFRVSARIAKPVAEVFDAVVNPKKLSGYFTTIGGASAPLVPGTTVTWWNEVPVEVDEVVPPKRIVLRWDASVPAEEAPYKTRIEMNFEPLGELHGAPLRLRVENQLGFKMVKWIRAVEFVENIRSVGQGQGGYNEDHEYFGELANI